MRSPWFLLVLALGCGGDGGPSLVVDLKTDLRPGIGFSEVRTLYFTDPSEAPREVRATPVTEATDVATGLRIADFEGIEAGTAHVQVTLMARDGRLIAARRVIVEVRGPTGVTVVIGSACVGVTCPSDLTCVNGSCQNPRCTPETPEYCDDRCDETSCTSPVSCGAPSCVDGVCLVETDDGACGAGRYCDPREGCLGTPAMDAGPRDTGTPDAGPTDTGALDTGVRDTAPDTLGCMPAETRCTDGMDDDCDGAVDCADPDCSGASCDNGVFCDGADSCIGGTCTAPGVSPCGAATCYEGSRACGDCAVRADCPDDSFGLWTCAWGFCNEVTDSYRDGTTWDCVANRCTATDVREIGTGACMRDSDGITCGPTTYGTWSSCTYSTVERDCDESGDRTRSVTYRRCVMGSCQSLPSSETQTDAAACARTTSGDPCRCLAGCTPCTCSSGVCNYTCP